MSSLREEVEQVWRVLNIQENLKVCILGERVENFDGCFGVLGGQQIVEQVEEGPGLVKEFGNGRV